MRYYVSYSCVSHIGNHRSVNQDNFICGGKYLDGKAECGTFPLTGRMDPGSSSILGVFDGMGGEERGEIAALLAAEEAARIVIAGKPAEALRDYCARANERLCRYAEEQGISSMGTTAAILAFLDRQIVLCNIGDSKIFRFADNELDQLSFDHVAVSAYGVKPPLSQNLGIPPSEMVIEPYIAQGQYHEGDIYLICTDGLTDMLSCEEIQNVLVSEPFGKAADGLLRDALAHGGRDNITIILCRIEKEQRHLFRRFFEKSNR